MIKLENIQVKFGDFTALKNINIDIQEGEFFHISWTFRMRQDHDPSDHYRIYPAKRRESLCPGQGHHRYACGKKKCGNGISKLCFIPNHERV